MKRKFCFVNIMSDHSARPFLDSEATSGTCSRAHPQSSWMSHWIKRGPKPASVVNNSSLVCYKNEDIDTRLKIEDNFPTPFKGLGLGKEVVDEMGPRMVNEKRTEKTGDFLNKINHSPSVSAFNACHNKAHMDDEFGDKAMSLALSLGKEEIVKNFDALKKTHLRKTEKRPMCPPTYHNGGTTDLRLSSSSHFAPDRAHNGDSSSSGGPLMVFERHFSNDNFTCLDKGHCKYQKFSTFLFHEKKTNNNEHNNNSLDPRQSDEKKNVNNFLPFHPKGRSENPHRAPRSVRNVETMRICTMVDSVENSPGGPPKIVSQRAHHFLFTKETCVNVSEGNTFGSSPRAQGVKIQPLWTSTDSEEKENTGNNPSSTCKAGSRNVDDESSAESEPTPIKDPENQHTVFGSASSPLNKDDMVDSSTEKARSKRPITEIPDINEDLPGLKPAVSSTDITDPTTSRVHSFNTKKLFFPCSSQEQPELNVQNAPPLGPDDSGTSRWIKRLKSSDSSGIGTRSSNPLEEASSSHEKFNLFLNKIMKSHKTPIIEENTLSGPHGKDTTRPFMGPPSFGGPSKRNRAMVLGGSWIQRWCRNPTTTTTTTTPIMRNNPENLVICEPHTLKFSSTQEELSKKQFPSIAAMALMGKAMNGFRPCEFRKMGPVVVWKANEY